MSCDVEGVAAKEILHLHKCNSQAQYKEVQCKEFTNAKRAWEEERRKIPQTTIDTLIDSMPRRCQAVIDAKGFATKY